MSMCVLSLYHIWSQAQSVSICLMNEVKRCGFLQVDTIGSLLLLSSALSTSVTVFVFAAEENSLKSQLYFNTTLLFLI